MLKFRQAPDLYSVIVPEVKTVDPAFWLKPSENVIVPPMEPDS